MGIVGGKNAPTLAAILEYNTLKRPQYGKVWADKSVNRPATDSIINTDILNKDDTGSYKR